MTRFWTGSTHDKFFASRNRAVTGTASELILAGALADPVDGAALLFAGNSADIAASFARDDPYVVNGLVTRWRVREWTTVVGEGAATPVGAERT